MSEQQDLESVSEPEEIDEAEPEPEPEAIEETPSVSDESEEDIDSFFG